MSKKNTLDNVVLEFQNTLDNIISKSNELLRENVKKDVSKKIAEDIDDEDESEETVTDIDLGSEEGVADEENTDTETEDETNLDDVVSDETDVTTDDTLDDLGSEEDSEVVDTTDDVSNLDGLGDDTVTDTELGVDADVPVDGELSDVIGDIVDGTQLSDEDLVRVFKDITDETDIQVTKDDDNTVSFSNGTEKYVFKLNENDSRLDFINKLFGDSSQDAEETQENVFELHIEENTETAPVDTVVTETVAEEEVVDNSIDEVLRTHADGHKMVRKPEGFYKYASSRLREGLNESVATNLENQRLIKESNELRGSVENLINENKNLTGELTKYHETLILMKEQLDKVALINRKMGYINRLFCEHATTKTEKESILERFDNESVTDDKSAKALYKTISNELSTVKTNKVNESVNTSSIIGEVGKSLLAESEKANNEKNPLNEQLSRMQHLMGVNYKKN